MLYAWAAQRLALTTTTAAGFISKGWHSRPMIYLASRSHLKYLLKLREVARRPCGYHLVAISGGLAFLHAVNSRTQSLTLIDRDPQVNGYVAGMLELLVSCETRWQFFELLSGHRSNRVPSGALLFRPEPSEVRQANMHRLSPSARELLVQLYPAEGFDAGSCTTTTAAGTVHFRGVNLTPLHFNWMSDWGAFETEADFAELRGALKALKLSIHTMALEEWQFSACPEVTLVLASNTDSPLFTVGDPVLREIARSGNPHVFYISRTRDTSAPERDEPSSFGTEQLVTAPMAVGFPSDAEGLLRRAWPVDWRTVSYADYAARSWYDEECLAFFVDGAEPQELRRLLEAAPPIHQRLLFFGDPAGVTSLGSFAQFLTYRPGPRWVADGVHGALHYLGFRIPYSAR